MSPNEIFFSIQQRIEAYKPKLNWNDMDRHVRLITKDLHHVFSYNEHEAYFCFAYYITQSGEHFTEKGIAFKIKQLPKLVEIVDPTLYERITSLNVELWTFCHRKKFEF